MVEAGERVELWLNYSYQDLGLAGSWNKAEQRSSNLFQFQLNVANFSVFLQKIYPSIITDVKMTEDTCNL